jgi:hypothetical protein
MAKLDIALRFPLERAAPMNVGGMPFHQWCPGEADAIQIPITAGVLRLWADPPSRHQEVSEWLNVQVTHLRGQVSIASFEDELVPVLRSLAESHERGTPALDAFGRTFLAEVLRGANAVLAHLRARKLLYWLSSFDDNSTMTYSEYRRLDAMVSIDGDSPIPFRPCRIDTLSGPHPGLWRSIRREEWVDIRRAVESRTRPSIVGELLAAALQHLANEEHRVALTEACSALEITLDRFGKDAAADDRWQKSGAGDGRIQVENLSRHILHLGVTGTVRFLLPLLFKPEELPAKTVKSANRALEIRHSIVHGGRRDVNHDEAELCVGALIDLIGILLPDVVPHPAAREN